MSNNNISRLGILLLIILVKEASLVEVGDQFETANEPCAPDGKVVCNADTFQQCGSGKWSALRSLAAGQGCSLFNIGSQVAQVASTTSLVGPVSQAFCSDAIIQPTQTTFSATSKVLDPEKAAQIAASSTTSLGDVRPVSQAYSGDKMIKPAQTTSSANSGVCNPQAVAPSYSGDASKFPPISQWLSFDDLWECDKDACQQNPGKADIIRQGILQVAKESGVDERIILAVILQESSCSLTVAEVGGLMQSHNGVSYTNDDSILQMIRDGTSGTYYKGADGGDGLKQVIGKYGVYKGLRAYNSGENGVDPNDLSSTPADTGNPKYVSQIANRLTGAMK